MRTPRAILRTARRYGRNAVLWLSLFSFALTVGGIPSLEGARLSGEAFPCQGHRCGCRSAADCWNGCSCSSMAEKIAWANRHGVIPPAHAFEIAAQERATLAKGCCKAKAKSCCSGQGCSKTEDVTSEPTLRTTSCRGAAMTWLTLGAILSLPEFAAISHELIGGEVLTIANEFAVSVPARPVAPPPRATA